MNCYKNCVVKRQRTVEDGMTSPVQGVFWHRPEVQDSIARLATEPKLTLLTGAGASAEVGFPLWGVLVRRLLEAATAADPRLKLNQQARAAFLERVTDEGAIAAASYAQALLGARMDHILGEALYRDVLAPRLPGATAMSAAQLYAALGSGAELVTLNYDDQLLVAFEQLGSGLPSRSARTGGASPERHSFGTCTVKYRRKGARKV